MLGGLLNKSVFLTLVCQRDRQGRAIDTRWVRELCGVSKSTALLHLQKMVDEGELIKDVLPWRANAKKFRYHPSERTMFEYLQKVFINDYRTYMQAMMEA